MNTPAATSTAQNEQIKTLEAALCIVTKERDNLRAERDSLRASHERLRLELELMKHRIFVAKAERVDTKQLELEFAGKLAELNKVSNELAEGLAENGDGPKDPKKKRKPSGRRDLSKAVLEEDRIELKDPALEEQVKNGEAEALGFEESYKIVYKRGGMRRLVLARMKYRTNDELGELVIKTVSMPKEFMPRSFATPSLLAHVVTEKICDGLPLHRMEDRFARDGFELDRGTMCRWLEEAGATLGATVIAAARKHAMSTAFCIATDATGILVQPEPSADKTRQPCRRAHYFVLVVDKDHIFFEYTPKETSEVVAEMFKDFSGFVQADAKSVYNVLFAKQKNKPPDNDDKPKRHELACWSHGRRGFWEAATQKNAVGREGLYRISRIFAIDEQCRGVKSPVEIKRLRDAFLRPHIEAFFVWAADQYELVRDQRGTIRSALGYALRHQEALTRVLDDGRFILENNRSERALRKIAVGRNAWLFVGSDEHGEATGHLFSMIASARLHGLDPERYLRDIFRVLAYWPSDRHLELAPKFWAATRSRLDAGELDVEVGVITVPPLH